MLGAEGEAGWKTGQIKVTSSLYHQWHRGTLIVHVQGAPPSTFICIFHVQTSYMEDWSIDTTRGVRGDGGGGYGEHVLPRGHELSCVGGP